MSNDNTNNDLPEAIGLMENATTVFYNTWDPKCCHPGCTEDSEIIVLVMLPTGERAVSSRCMEHAVKQQRFLIQELGFMCDEEGAFVNLKVMAEAMDGMHDKLRETQEAINNLDGAVDLKAHDIETGDQVLMPDGQTWLKVESIVKETDDRYTFTLSEGFMRPMADEVYTVRRAEGNGEEEDEG